MLSALPSLDDSQEPHPAQESTRPGWGECFSDQEKRITRDACGLLTMELELSHACDLRCLYCYADSGNALPGELILEEILDTINQAAGLGARKVIVLGGGEPLVYPGLFTVLEHLHELGLGIELFTNGVTLTCVIARRLATMGVRVVIKMNSQREGVQDALTGKAGTFKAIQAALAALAEAGYPGSGMPLGAQTIVCRQNIDELPELWMALRQRRIIPYFETLTLQGRARRHPELLVSAEEIMALFQELAAIDRRHFGLEWTPRPPVAAFSCDRHEYSCLVTSTGDVLPCPGVDLAVGNIRKSSLADILKTSPVIADLRNIRRRIKGPCAQCPENAGCYGCRGMAYQATGDYLASDPLCAHALVNP